MLWKQILLCRPNNKINVISMLYARNRFNVQACFIYLKKDTNVRMTDIYRIKNIQYNQQTSYNNTIKQLNISQNVKTMTHKVELDTTKTN